MLRLAAQGRTNPEIAETTGLARNTVKTYLQAALHKLGARNRVEAIGKASEAGLLCHPRRFRPPRSRRTAASCRNGLRRVTDCQRLR